MNRRPLADEVAAALAEFGPCAGTELARIVGARKSDVLDVLRSAPRFSCHGRGRASVWRLAGTEREPQHGDERTRRDQDVAAILDRLTAVEAGLAAIMRLLAPHAAEVVEPLAGQLSVDDALAAANGHSPASTCLTASPYAARFKDFTTSSKGLR